MESKEVLHFVPTGKLSCVLLTLETYRLDWMLGKSCSAGMETCKWTELCTLMSSLSPHRSFVKSFVLSEFAQAGKLPGKRNASLFINPF